MAWPTAIHSKKVDEAMQLAQQKNILIVSSAGNDGTTANVYPCVYENVVCVGSQGPDGALSHFSNYGSMVDVLAPGTAILSTWPLTKSPVTFAGQVGYEFRNGTSMSAPFVTGALAELLSRGYSANEAKNRIILGSRETSRQRWFSSDIVGTYTHDVSTEARNIRFGNLDLTRALGLQASPAILPLQKSTIDVEWDGDAREIIVPIEWKNRWIASGQVEIVVNGQSFHFAAVPSQASVVTPVRLSLGKNPESVLHLNAAVHTKDFNKEQIEITLQLIRPLKSTQIPKEALTQNITGIQVKDFTDVRSVSTHDQNLRSDLILARSNATGVELALIQGNRYFASAEINDFKMDQFLKFYRLADQSYVAIFTKPDPKVTRPDFFIQYFDAQFKFLHETVLGTETTVLPETFQWMPLHGGFTPIFISLGFTPPLDLPAYDPWNPKFEDIKTFRLYYLDGKDLRIVPMTSIQYPLQILTDGRILISEGNSYFQKYKLLKLREGRIMGSEELSLAQYRMLIGLETGIPVLDLKGTASTTTAMQGASSPGNLRVTAIGESPFDQVLARATILDALMSVSGIFSDLSHQYYFVQTHYDLVFYTSGSDRTLSTSLNRYSYIPSMNFSRSFYPAVVRDENGNGLPGMYIPASIANGNTSEVIVASPAQQKLYRPAKFHFQVQDADCSALGNLIPARAGETAKQVFVCGNTIIQVPLQISRE